MTEPDIDWEVIRSFWRWIKSKSCDLARILDGQPNDLLLDSVGERVGLLCADSLGWELGPGVHQPYALCLSPCGDASLLSTTRKITALSPNLAEWEFHPAKPPKQWVSRTVELLGPAPVGMSFDSWVYTLTAYSQGSPVDGERFDIDLYPDLPLPMERAPRLDQLALLLVEGELGEELMLERIGDVRAHREPSSKPQATEIEYLHRHVVWALQNRSECR